MYPSYKYRPKKRNSGSSTVNLPPSPPSSSPSLQDTDQDTDSLGSLEDLDLLDLADIEDNGMQNIIEEVMSEDVENIPPPNSKVSRYFEYARALSLVEIIEILCYDWFIS